MNTDFAKQVKKAGRDCICIHYQNMDLYFPYALVISCPFVGYKSVVRPSIQFTDTLRGDISSVQFTYNIRIILYMYTGQMKAHVMPNTVYCLFSR